MSAQPVATLLSMSPFFRRVSEIIRGCVNPAIYRDKRGVSDICKRKKEVEGERERGGQMERRQTETTRQ